MNIYVDRKPENCNRCKFKQDASKYLDVEDYCILNKKKICRIRVDKDCPLGEMKSKGRCLAKILGNCSERENIKLQKVCLT